MLPLLASLPELHVVLWIVWASLLFGGFAFGRPDAARTRRMPMWTRLASSATLVIAAWSWLWQAPLGPGVLGASPFALLIAFGMAFGCLGDLLMARVIPTPQPVLGGMAAFGVGHALYIAAAIEFGKLAGRQQPGPRFGAWAVWLVLGTIGWYLAVMKGQHPTALHWASLPYALLLSSTAGLATGLALQTSALVPFALGAVLFLLSDLFLAARLFTGRRLPLAHDVIWLTYGPGQMLIVYGSFFGLLSRLGV
jgi:hypothetical protein